MTMLVKLLFLGACVLLVAQRAESVHIRPWTRVSDTLCVGPRGDRKKEFTYTGPDSFIVAMKLVHIDGKIGCNPKARSNWGCDDNHPINMIVTDTRDKRIYPSKTQVELRPNGWYELPGYGPNSPTLVFADPGFRFLARGDKMRIWYGEDLYGRSEGDNAGHTCFQVFVYAADI